MHAVRIGALIFPAFLTIIGWRSTVRADYPNLENLRWEEINKPKKVAHHAATTRTGPAVLSELGV